MGIVVKQSILLSTIYGIGMLMGVISVLYIYPLDPISAGIANNILGLGYLLSGFILFGGSNLAVKGLFSKASENFKMIKLKHLVLILFITGFVFSLLTFIFKANILHILKEYEFDVALVEQYGLAFILLAFLIAGCSLFIGYSVNLNRLVFTSMMVNVGQKMFLPVLIVCIYLGYFSAINLVWGILGFYLCLFVFLYLYLSRILSVSEKPSGSFKELLSSDSYGFYIFAGLANLGWIFASRVDAVIIGGMLGYQLVTAYMMPLFMASVFDFPANSISNVVSPIVRNSLSANKWHEVQDLYQRSSVNLYTIGLAMFMLLYSSYDDIVGLSSHPEVYQHTKFVFLLLALGKLVDLATGINNIILTYSNYYKWNFIFIGILAILNIFLAFNFVNTYGIIAMAASNLTALLVFNVLKTAFLYHKHSINPFSLATIKLTIFGIVLFVVIQLLPSTGYGLLDICLRSLLICCAFVVFIAKVEISDELRQLMSKYQKMVMHFRPWIK